ncbi:oxidoreductase, molybdopterin-binding [Myxococcus xanthus DK 1622]|uniref:Oxidoreductase, molybdopterin-binding n=1 Tax=Myxococcus xanthus (strain DK1622) TaxID=246197 RepID=Q1D1V2_MYXXD|nr:MULTISPECIES: molybdopterin-dependent oxidoreductase [Myxococcus]ABF91000.1 oxidoreductase, molybdopterin-binding [Myxococcus xanthus DK 1622]QZZ52885.1 Protein-methionine-sulfoxide reductase catalytic subunit MsrP [Myxococcus xanthus]UYI12582.1 molybdopterin-dependent oxidoreductase [Myxococcus xanthus]UYI19950.1 molybdopterin-dependent oxidoreductase [Myxococcus xanthus]SDY03500.1 DMSO/TMAO reductase YedYZ, molybdopterin-dependent catalytic subunit [Myxococcus xanthus]
MADPPKPTATPPPPSGADRVSPELVKELRERLTKGEDVVDPKTWAGSIPAAFGIAPRLRIGANRWFNLVWLLPIGWGLLLFGVAVAQYLRGLPAVEGFIHRHPGTGFATAFATPMPVWLRAQHFLNLFFLIFIIRAGLQILADHPRLYWTRHSTPGKEWLRMQKQVPDLPLWTAKQDSLTLPKHLGLPGIRHSIGLARWWHLGIDMLWLANGLVFYVLLFATGEWRRIVPTNWQVFPDAASALLQYLSLRWPQNDGWVAYNGLQIIAYFITVFIAAPLALMTGLGMSPALSTRFHGISKRLSIQTARSLHFLVLCWFILFTFIHVTMVFATGLLRNLNHVYAGTDANDWVGFGIFAVSMAVVVIAWVAATPFTLRHPRVVQRVGYSLIGPAQRLFEHLDAKPGTYTDKDISPYFWHNGKYPETPEYRALFDNHFADYRLRIHGLVENPVELSLDELRAMPRHEQITQHFCIQGWSGVAKWGGVSMQTLLELVRPKPDAKWVVFYSLGDGSDGGRYYDAHPIAQMHYQLTMLAYDMNGEPLSYGHGAPLRLRNEVQLGFKQVKWIAGIEFVADFFEVGGGYGGYDEDHEFFGYRQSI